MATFVLTENPDVFPALGQDVSGNDTIFGLGGDDEIDGGSGSDVFIGGAGDDTFLGGGGVDLDTADYSDDPGPIQVNQRENAFQNNIPPDTVLDGYNGRDSIPGVRNIVGSAFADDIRGGGHANVLNGNGGNDFIFGFDGRDTIIGGTGDDTLDGGSGIDTAVFSGARARYAVASGPDDTFVVMYTGPGPSETDTLTNIEVVEFGDGVFQVEALIGDPLRAPAGSVAAGPAAEALAGDVVGLVKEGFFFDTGLVVDLGKDTISTFGLSDYLVTTSLIFDSNKDGIVNFGRNGVLDLPGATGRSPSNPLDASATGQVTMINTTGQPITRLNFDGSVIHNGIEYFVYSQIGSGATTADVLFA
jgi:hypothetical protein